MTNISYDMHEDWLSQSTVRIIGTNLILKVLGMCHTLESLSRIYVT